VTSWLRLILCFTPLAVRPAAAADLFRLDQRYGSIAFTVDNFGAFSSTGSFPRFTGRLLIDRQHPEQTKIDVEADATAVVVAWESGTELLRGPDFFDTAHYREVRFVSDAIKGLDPKHFEVDGTLEIRGIKRPLILEATLVREQTDSAKATEIADFTVKGTLSRADYGMTTQTIMISDRVRIQIAVRIELPAQTR
jgi:polyisoprenoid-binding protein YceI